MEDLEQYMSGRMSASERNDFEQKLAANPDLRAELDVRSDLQYLRVEQRVTGASIQYQQWRRQRFFRRILLLVIGTVVLILAFFIYQNNRQTPDQQDIPAQQPATQPVDIQNNTPKHTPTQNNTTQPMAQAKPSHTTTEKPQLRSVYADLDALSRQVLDTLLQQTLRPAPGVINTAMHKKAIGYIVEGRITEAINSIFDLEKYDAPEAQWLLAIALLAEGKTENAESILLKISQTKTHPRREAALQALQKLQE